MMSRYVFGLSAVLALSGLGTGLAEPPPVIRLGHFPNVTHAQAVLARATQAYEKELGGKIQWATFNAGPSAVEALFAEAIDATYIGPNPTVNGYVKSGGKSFCVVAGSACGGAALVVRNDAPIERHTDFHNRTVATPQLGNTQDVAARAWFAKQGYRLKEKGGDLTLLSLANPDQLLMFRKKQLDAAWTVEPWVSRLLLEGNGRVYLEERSLWPEGQYVTAHLIVSRKFLEKNPKTVKSLIRAHVAMTRQIAAEPSRIIELLRGELKSETGKDLNPKVIEGAFSRVTFTWDPAERSLQRSALDAYEAGFMKTKPDLAGLYDLRLLNEVLAESGLPPVKTLQSDTRNLKPIMVSRRGAEYDRKRRLEKR